MTKEIADKLNEQLSLIGSHQYFIIPDDDFNNPEFIPL